MDVQQSHVAYQMRLGGAKVWVGAALLLVLNVIPIKGLLLLDQGKSNLCQDSQPRIGLRRSQIKVAYTSNSESSTTDPRAFFSANAHLSHLIVDVIRPPRLTSPANLSVEILINLENNGISSQTLCNVLEASLRTSIAGLTKWDTPSDLLQLWTEIFTAGGVRNTRLARAMQGSARAKGVGPYDRSDESDGEDEEQDNQSLAWWGDTTSGCPSTIHETALVMLDAGFTPQTQPFLAEKLKQIIEMSIRRYTTKLQIVAPMSASAFIVPGIQ